MQPSASPSIPIRFGPFEVDLAATELRKRGRKVPLQDQPFKVLALLVQRRGDLVSREELQRALWPSDTFGEFDEGLNKAVQKLRQALDDSSDNPRFIETLPRKGYRFIAAVDSAIEDAATTSQPAPAAAPPNVGTIKREKPKLWAWLLVGIVLLALLVVAGVHFWSLHPTAQPFPKAVPLTSYPGRQITPALSPDGKQVAFAWDGEKGENFDIYVKLVDAGAPLRLTSSPANEFAPAWSPDARYVAFCRESFGHVEIWMIPALGGVERKVGESALCAGLSWSPNGKFLALVDKTAPQAPMNIFLLSVESGDKRKITSSPSGDYWGDWDPHFSPDGRKLAFHRNAATGDIYTLALSDNGTPEGEPRELISDHRSISDFDWTADSRSIVYASQGIRAGLWIIAASGGLSKRLPAAAENATEISLARNGERLVYVRSVDDDNIWRIPGPKSINANDAPTKLIASTRMDREPQYSRAGDRIAFCSNRSGSVEVWICDGEGHNPHQATSFGGPPAGSARWSPDSKWIAFDCIKEHNFDIYLISADGGVPRRLTTGPSENATPSWSRDGRWIYFCSRRSGEPAIWKVPAQGGTAIQIVNTKGGNQAFESPDGQSVYYTRDDEPGIWKVPVSGGKATRVIEQGAQDYWSGTDEGICFFTLNEPDGPTLRFFSFAEQKASVLRKFSKETRIHGGDSAISASADGRWIIYTQLDQLSSDLMLVENFR